MATTGRVDADGFGLPFNGSITVSRHCSYEGAVHAAERVARQCLALLAIYRRCGPTTDAEAAAHMSADLHQDIERTTINARRAELIERDLVEKKGTRKNPKTGITNTTWGLAGA